MQWLSHQCSRFSVLCKTLYFLIASLDLHASIIGSGKLNAGENPTAVQ